MRIFFIFILILVLDILVTMNTDLPILNYLSGFIGLILVRKGIMCHVSTAYKKLKEKKRINQEGLETLTVMFSGLLFLIPGLVTDCLGAILLVPICKNLFINYYLKTLIRKK